MNISNRKQIVSRLLTFALANYSFCFVNDCIVEIKMNTAVTYLKCANTFQAMSEIEGGHQSGAVSYTLAYLCASKIILKKICRLGPKTVNLADKFFI